MNGLSRERGEVIPVSRSHGALLPQSRKCPMRAVTRREERDRVGRKKRGGRTVEEKEEEKGVLLVGDFSFSLTCPIIVLRPNVQEESSTLGQMG